MASLVPPAEGSQEDPIGSQLAAMQVALLPADEQGGLVSQPSITTPGGDMRIRDYQDICAQNLKLARETGVELERTNRPWAATYQHTIANHLEDRYDAAQKIQDARSPQALQVAQDEFTHLVHSQTARNDYVMERATRELFERNDRSTVVRRISHAVNDVVNYPAVQNQVIGAAKFIGLRFAVALVPEVAGIVSSIAADSNNRNS